MGDYAKRRFTILGAVNKPGSFFFPAGESVSLLQAIGMAGGYSRVASPSKITIKRGDAKAPLKVDAKKMAESGAAATFMILPGDIITVGESIF
jgi:polysaccharide export outer membrane protein